ncbi:MAG TPA: cytochrome c biogenesis protein CcsA, partial [Verrucomicrobiae bacterium]|nr:cytochrome c biogenesis protein CcsA [Verrucomicrobiae bacterium]
MAENLLWFVMGLYLAAWLLALAGSIFKRPALHKYCHAAGLAGLLVQSYVLISRWVGIGHPPLFGTFENTQAGAWVLVLFTMILAIFYPRLKFSGIATYIWAVVLMGFGMIFNQNRIPLTISEQSLWVDLHVIFAWLAFGSFFMAWGIALRFLRKKPMADNWVQDRMLQFLLFGFVTYTVMILLGSVYEFFLFGKWWQWDIVETISLVTWLYYG